MPGERIVFVSRKIDPESILIGISEVSLDNTLVQQQQLKLMTEINYMNPI